MSNHQDVSKELKIEFLAEIQRVQKDVHHFIDNLTAISGYTQLAQLRPERSVVELPKIIHIVEKCMDMLRACIISLKEFEKRHFAIREHNGDAP